jgi:hypothetical protein
MDGLEADDDDNSISMMMNNDCLEGLQNTTTVVSCK